MGRQIRKRYKDAKFKHESNAERYRSYSVPTPIQGGFGHLEGSALTVPFIDFLRRRIVKHLAVLRGWSSTLPLLDFAPESVMSGLAVIQPGTLGYGEAL